MWLAHEANRSGANICLQEFMEHTAARNIDQILVVPHAGNMLDVAEQVGCSSKIVPVYGWMINKGNAGRKKNTIRTRLRNFAAVMQLSVIIIKNKATVVFTNTSTVHVGAFAARITGRKHFWYVHELGEEDFNVSLPRGIRSVRWMNKNSVSLFGNSVYLLEKFQKMLPGINMKVLRNPVTVTVKKDYPGSISEPVKLLMLGQVSNAKGQHIAIQAVHKLIEMGSTAILTIAGTCHDPLFKKQLLSTISDLSLQQNVVFQNFTNFPQQLISQHDILLMCSRCEAYGRVTVEAMKIGVPVVGANTCGTKELLEDRVSGLLFNLDSPDSLALQIDLLVKDQELAKKISKGAMIRAGEISGIADFDQFLNSLQN